MKCLIFGLTLYLWHVRQLHVVATAERYLYGYNQQPNAMELTAKQNNQQSGRNAGGQCSDHGGDLIRYSLCKVFCNFIFRKEFRME